jgi:hypothetical protein
MRLADFVKPKQRGLNEPAKPQDLQALGLVFCLPAHLRLGREHP